MTYSLHPETEAELMAATIYFAEHASKRVANAFLDEFERIASIVGLGVGNSCACQPSASELEWIINQGESNGNEPQGSS